MKPVRVHPDADAEMVDAAVQEQSNGGASTQLAGFDGVRTGPDEERPFIPKVDRWFAKWIWL